MVDITWNSGQLSGIRSEKLEAFLEKESPKTLKCSQGVVIDT